MKKNVLLLVLICFGTFFGYAEDILSHTYFVGFEGVELSFEEAKFVTVERLMLAIRMLQSVNIIL